MNNPNQCAFSQGQDSRTAVTGGKTLDSHGDSCGKRGSIFPVIVLFLTVICFFTLVAFSGCKDNPTSKNDHVSDTLSDTAKAESNTAYVIELYGKEFMSDVSTIDLTSVSISDTEELLVRAKEFTNLQSINVTDCGLSDDELLETQNKLGDVILIWNVSICGLDIPSDTRFLFISQDEANPNYFISFTNTDSENKMLFYQFPYGVVGDSVEVHDSKNIYNIKYLSNLEGLRLSFESQTHFDISCLENFKKLKSITLEGNIDNISILAKMPQIEELSTNVQVPDEYEFLSALVHLRKLDIGNFGTKVSVSILDSMENIEELALFVNTGTEYQDLMNELKSKKSLYTLFIYFNTAANIDFSLINDTYVSSLGISALEIGSGSMDTLCSLENVKNLHIYSSRLYFSVESETKLKNTLSGRCTVAFDLLD